MPQPAAGQAVPPTYHELERRVRELEAQAVQYREQVRRLQAACALLHKEKDMIAGKQ